MSAPAPARFNFDLDLARANAGAQAPDAAEIARIAAKARAEGFAEAKAEATTRTAEAMAAAASKIATRTTSMLGELDTARAGYRRQAAALALGMARKLASGLIERQPVDEIETLFNECLTSLDHTPHLAIRCNDALANQVRDMAEKGVAQHGYSGRLIIIGEPGFKPGDCRIEWVDGGIVRDMDVVADAINKRVTAYLDAPPTAENRAIPAPGTKP
jgi:flagellar assembly protein FliH